MICYVCDATTFESLAELNKERELLVCKSCGSAMYRVEPEKEEEIKEYYRHQYRPAPNHFNLLTTGHKQKYIEIFLGEFLAEKKGKSLVCGDVGCATGYIPNWLRGLGHKATGCELTVTYRRFAEHFYGVPVTEELTPKHKYDLITIYHVLEHLMKPDVKLKGYVDLLADDGHILVSTPEWLDTLEEASGSPISTFEQIFHKDHINVFSKASLQNLFIKAGLEIVKEDHLQYGQTYLLKKAGPSAKPKGLEERIESWEAVVGKIRTQHTAIGLYNAKKYDEAIAIWPKFPDAWIRKIHEDFTKDRNKQADIYVEALKVLSTNSRVQLSYGTWLYMGEELDAAVKVFNRVLELRPNEDVLIYTGWALAKLGRNHEAMQVFNHAATLSPLKWAECMTAICKLAVSMPCWEERAVEEAKAALFAKSGIKPQLKDPAMEPVGG